MYGSGTVEVRLNNVLVDQDEAETCGNITFGYSPSMSDSKHSIFELSFRASPGSFGVQLHDPGKFSRECVIGHVKVSHVCEIAAISNIIYIITIYLKGC